MKIKVYQGKFFDQQLNKAYTYILECYKKDVLHSRREKKK